MKHDGSSRRRVALRRRIDRVLRDGDSGAAEIASAAARVLMEAVALGYTPHRLERIKKQLVQSHPAMAPLWQLVNAEDPREFAAGLRTKVRDTLGIARRKLPKTGSAITMSYSSSVIAAIARKGRLVYVAESLPGGEGARTARALKKRGVTCEVIPDSVVMYAAGRATFGIIGADAVTPNRIVNKVGSHLLAVACREQGIPFYVVADSSKLVPDEWVVPDYDPKQPFESVPRNLVTEIFCDQESS